jgi:hypothetical protein
MAFPEDPHHKAYVCNHIFEHSRPILLVSRQDGDWCFLCGEEHENDASAYKLVGIGHILNFDRSLSVLHDLPVDWDAERVSVEQEWVRSPCEPGKY